MKQIRIEWKINGHEGHGSWFDDTEKSRASLELWINQNNIRYGTGTHWLGVK